MNLKKLARVCDSVQYNHRVLDSFGDEKVIFPKEASLRERIEEVLDKTNDGGAETVYANVTINGDAFTESFYYENWNSHYISGPGFFDSWDNDSEEVQEDKVRERFLDWVEKNYPANAKVSGVIIDWDGDSNEVDYDFK